MARRWFRIFSKVLLMGFLGWLLLFLYTEEIGNKVVPYEDRLKLLLEEFKSKPLLFDLAKVSDPPNIGESLLQKSEQWLKSFLYNSLCSTLSSTFSQPSSSLVTADRHLLVCDAHPHTRRLWRHVNQSNGNMQKVGDLEEKEVENLFSSSETRKLLITCSPFSKVLEVYVETFFKPNVQGWLDHGEFAIKLSKGEWRRHQYFRLPPCYHDVTFPEYLTYLNKNIYNSPVLLKHINDPCDSCTSRYDVVLHHETIWQALLNMTGPVEAKRIWDAAGAEQIREDIEQYQSQRANISKCIKPHVALQRLWRSWQIYGILDVNAKFPFSSLEKAEKASPEQFEELAVQAMSVANTSSSAGKFYNEILALKEVFAETELETKLKLEFMLRAASLRQGYKPDPYFLYQSNGVFFREDELSMFSISYY